MSQVKDTLWPEALSLLAKELDSLSFETWFAPVQASWDGSELNVLLPSQFFLDWIQTHYRAQLETALRTAQGEAVPLRLRVDEGARRRWESGLKAPAAQDSPGRPAAPAAAQDVAAPELQVGLPLSPRYTFDSFVVGNSNRFASAACRAAGEAPSTAYNPLAIYGKPGLGKTHLLQAIGNHVQATRPELRVLHVTSEVFANAMVRCLRAYRMEDFRAAFRGVDVLLVDDIQFLEGKERMQEEFLNTFNSLFDQSKQIVTTSEKHPRELQLTEKLRSRFEWGLPVDIQPPDLETRIAILRKKCEAEGFAAPADVLLLIAESMRSSIRDMEGSLNRLSAYARIHNQEPSLALARLVLKDSLQGQARVISIGNIQNETAADYNLRPADLRGTARSSGVVLARHVAMYLSRKLTDASLTEIGVAFGGKNHSTVLHACDKIEELLSRNGMLITQIENLEARLRG